MVKINKVSSKKDDIKIISGIVLGFIILIWLFIPPWNKWLQLCFWNYHIRYFYTKVTNPVSLDEWLFHRNNAVYMAKMNSKEVALREIDKAILTLPSYAPDDDVENLYRDRALIRVWFKEYSGALDDYMHCKSITDINDMLRLAMLFKEKGNYKYAAHWCNNIIKKDMNAYAGFACIADIYDTLGRPDISVRAYDLLIDRNPKRAVYLADRAKYKEKAGDKDGASSDLANAIAMQSNIESQPSIIYLALNPKILELKITK